VAGGRKRPTGRRRMSAMMASAARLPTPVMVAEPVTGHGEWGDHLVHAGVQAGDRGLQVLQVGKGQPDQQPICSLKWPRRAWRSWGSFLRSLPLASSARTWGRARRGRGRPASPALRHQDVGGDRDPA
jgi:hypothetical protein